MSKKKENNQATKISLPKSLVLYDWVLIKPFTINVTSDGVFRPSQYDDKPEYGEVLAIGEGRLTEDGEIVPLKVKVGDKILFQKYSSEKVRDPATGEDLMLVKEEDIRCILTK